MSIPVDGRLALACAFAMLAVLGTASAQSQDPETAESFDLQNLDPAIDWSVLSTDAALLPNAYPDGRTITIVPSMRESGPAWSRTDRRDGSSAVTVNRSLTTMWDTKVGVDFGLPAAPSPLLTPDRLLAGTSADQSTGVAWARTTAPALNLPIGWDKASLDARFDPTQDQSTLGTRFSRSVPLGEQLSVTMESGFAVTHLRNQPLPSDLSSGQTVNVFDTERLAKLNFLASGTSFGAGSRKSSADDVWLNSLSAEQQLFGGISVTGTIRETLEGDTDKSLTAGFKRKW
jgi:hypothetical protein